MEIKNALKFPPRYPVEVDYETYHTFGFTNSGLYEDILGIRFFLHHGSWGKYNIIVSRISVTSYHSEISFTAAV